MSTFIDVITNLFDYDDFMPRWVCGNWSEFYGWLYILSNLLVFTAYFTIPLLLFKFIKRRKGLFFKRVVVCFILFIFLCGTTHLIDALIFWIPIYRVNAFVLFFTAFISWVTVFVLYKFLPIAAEYKSPLELQQIIDEQTKALTLAYHKIYQSEQQFKTLVNANPDIITLINKDLKYEFINDSILKVRRIGINDIIGKSLMEVEGSGDSQINNQFIAKVKETFATSLANSFEFSTYTNTTRNSYFSLSVIPIKGENTEEIEMVLTITKDVTIQKLNEIALNENIINLEMLAKKLERKRKILEDFTYIVSHNLRSPVSNLAALINLIKEEKNSEMRDMLFDKVIIAFTNLSSTVSDLTEVVQIRQNTDIPKQVLKFEDILNNHIVNLSTQIKATNAQVLADFTSCETIEYPKIYLESIFLNLLTNAIKYRYPKRGLVVKFSTTIDKEGVITLVCEDNGLGIDMEKYGDKLFGLKKTFHEHPDSRGVGLFITKNQIETMGGTIVAQSEVNVGTKFIIQFNSYLNQWREK